MLASNACAVVEAMVVEPVQGFLLNLSTAFRDKENVATELLLYEHMQGVEDARCCGGTQIVVGKERGIGPEVHSIGDDAADIDAKCYLSQRYVLLSKVAPHPLICGCSLRSWTRPDDGPVVWQRVIPFNMAAPC